LVAAIDSAATSVSVLLVDAAGWDGVGFCVAGARRRIWIEASEPAGALACSLARTVLSDAVSGAGAL
jgi:hypothetical protein